MKKTVFVFAVLAASAAFAENVKVMFSTPGPDTYADGTSVLKGECYALVWKAAVEDVVQIFADGTVSGGKVLFFHKTTEAGRCSKVLFQADEAKLDEFGFSGGVWSIQLLDTRTFGPDGAVTLAGLKDDGAPKLINGVGASVATVTVVKGNESVPVATDAKQIAVASKTALPAGADGTRPVITSIEIKGAYVHVTVANTLPYVNYGLESGTTPDGLSADAAAPQTGAATTSETITLVSPKSEGGAQFFKVNRK